MIGKIPALTGIRGVAASWVVLMHAHYLIAMLFGTRQAAETPIIGAGYLAVDLFFLLSGFILAATHFGKLERGFGAMVLDFGIGRVFRIVPLNTVALLVFLVLVTLVDVRHWATERLDWRSFWASLFLVQSWGIVSPTAWNTPAWSLSAEWLAYAVFPVGLVVLRTVKTPLLAAMAVTALLGVLAAIMITAGEATLDHTWKLGLVRCIIQFAAGACLWRLYALADLGRRRGDLLMGAGLALMLVVLADMRVQLLAPVAFAALILACAMPGRIAPALFANRAVMFLGDISFSLYLMHWSVLGAAAYVAEQWGTSGWSDPARIAFVIGVYAAVLATATLTYRLVELPGQRLGNRLRRPHRDEHSPVAIGESLVQSRSPKG